MATAEGLVVALYYVVLSSLAAIQYGVDGNSRKTPMGGWQRKKRERRFFLRWIAVRQSAAAAHADEAKAYSTVHTSDLND